MNADRIVVIEDGEVVEQGNHADLVTAKGRYADLWSKQTFLKPKDDEATAGGTKQDATNSDVPQENGTATEGATTSQAGQNTEAASNKAGNGTQAETPGHKREVESAEDSSLADSNH